MTAKDPICIVVSDPITIRAFLSDQIRLLSREYEVTVVMNHLTDDTWEADFPGVRFEFIQIVRKIDLYKDIRALWRLFSFFRSQKFMLVHSVTPKAGLLAMTAARFAAVRHRLHTFTGQVWATRSGVSRLLLKTMDRILASMTTEALTDSPSQCQFLVDEGVFKVGQGRVLGHGSISGVDTEKFRPDAESRCRVRHELGIGEDDLVFLFLGRINPDKGVMDLAKAYRSFREDGYQAHLVMAGPEEAGLGPMIESLAGDFSADIHFVGMTTAPQEYMAAADVFCLPSYREGFGSVVIEAASCEIPSIASRIYGLTDAVEENKTGLLHDPRDSAQIKECMVTMSRDEALRKSLGEEAAQRAKEFFSKEIISQALLDLYSARLRGK